MIDDWSGPVHTEEHADDWGDPVHRDTPPVKGSTRDNPLDDEEHAAGISTIARASLAPDPTVQMKRYAEAFKQPLADFGVVDDHIVRKIPGTETYARVQASVSGAEGPIDAVKRAASWTASGAGPAIPAITSAAGAAAAGILATPETLGAGTLPAAIAGGAAGATAGEIARQKLDAALAPKGKEAEMDWGNVGWQGAAGAAGPLVGKAVEAAAGPVGRFVAKSAPNDLASFVSGGGAGAAGEAALHQGEDAAIGAATSFGLSPRVLAALKEHISGKEGEIEALRKEAQDLGVDLSLGQLTGSEAVKTSERQLIRQPETVQAVADLRKSQNNEQIPGAVRKVMDEVAPDAPAGQQVEAFREGAQGAVKKGLDDRAAAAEIAYGEANKGGSIAPLEDQFRNAVQQVTAKKGSVMRQIADIEKNNSGALAARGAAGAEIRDKYMALSGEASEIEEARVAMLERLNQAKVDKTGNAPGAVWSPRLQEFLDDPDIKPGIARGLQIQRLEALAKGQKFDPTEYAITGTAEDGSPIVGSVPNMRLLHAVKKGIDAIIADNTDATTGRVNDLGRAAKLVQNSFLKEVDTLNPAYGTARAKFSEDSQAIDAIKEGGVGFLNKITGLDRQQIVNRVFSGDNVMPEDIAMMRRQFAYAGKQAEWHAGVRSYIADILADAVAPLKGGGEPANVGGAVYKNLFEDRQSKIIQAAMGGAENPNFTNRWNQLGRVMKAASNQLPEGSATATDEAAPGLVKRGVQALKYVLHPAAMGADLMDGLSKMKDPAEAKKLAETLLTPEGDKLLKSLAPVTPGTPKANSILTNMLIQAGVITAGETVREGSSKK